MLTKKQRDLLLLINERLSNGEIAPSFEEMKDLLGLKSKSGIHRLITALVERGYLERLPNRARALEVKRLPEGMKGNKAAAAPALPAKAKAVATTISDMLTLPLMGKIAAGTPIEAIRNEHEFIDIPQSMIGNGEHYALTVEGDSMIKAGINDSDVVIIRKANTARDGQIVVALVDGQEVTLKRLGREGGKIALIPENDAYKPRLLTPDRVQVQGILTSLLRTYH